MSSHIRGLWSGTNNHVLSHKWSGYAKQDMTKLLKMGRTSKLVLFIRIILYFYVFVLFFSLSQSILSEFIKVEMLFHSRVLEVYTDSWHCLNSISDEDDLEVSDEG